MSASETKPRFSLGTVVITPGALQSIPEEQVRAALRRHVSGDWGEVNKDDREENELSLREGFRLLSAYRHDGVKFWLITEADRSCTTVLLPEEY